MPQPFWKFGGENGLPGCTRSQVVFMGGGHASCACHVHPAGRRLVEVRYGREE